MRTEHNNNKFQNIELTKSAYLESRNLSSLATLHLGDRESILRFWHLENEFFFRVLFLPMEHSFESIKRYRAY